MKEDFCCHRSCDFFEKTEVQLFQSHLISLKTTSSEYQGLRVGSKIHSFCPSWMFLSLDATFNF